MTTAHALNASAFAGAKVTPARGARSSAVGRKSVVTRAMAVKTKTLSIPKTFEELKRRGQCAFIPFICAGDGGIDTTEKAVRILDEVGSDVIELGVPYSDPLADGPTIQVRAKALDVPRSGAGHARSPSPYPKTNPASPTAALFPIPADPTRAPVRVRALRPQAAATRALEAGTTLDQVIDLVARVTPDVSAPIVLFTYYNPIYQRGFEPFVKKIAAAGAKGLLVPDIPLEETGELSAVCKANGLDLVLLSTPTTPTDRMAKIAEKSNGFIYLVSVTGVTGVRSGVESRVEGLVKSLKSVTDKPVAVGFGISKREQAAEVVQWGADGVIVGSALVKALGEAKTPEDGLAALKELAVELREGSNREGAKPKGSGGGFFARLMGKA